MGGLGELRQQSVHRRFRALARLFPPPGGISRLPSGSFGCALQLCGVGQRCLPCQQQQVHRQWCEQTAWILGRLARRGRTCSGELMVGWGLAFV